MVGLLEMRARMLRSWLCALVRAVGDGGATLAHSRLDLLGAASVSVGPFQPSVVYVCPVRCG